MKLLIMRHGETSWNQEGRLQGQTDISLCEDGIVMAESCADGMKDIPVDICFSSSLKRAEETARIIVRKNNGYGQRAKSILKDLEKENFFENPSVKLYDADEDPIVTDSRIIEAAFGPWEGLICKKEGYNVPLEDFGTYWRDPDSPLLADGVEHLTWVAKRVTSFFDDLRHLAALKDKTVLLVVHGCVMRVVSYLIDHSQGFCGRVSYNCEVIIAEPKDDGGLEYLGSEIYYDRSMVHDNYSGMKRG